MQPSKKYRVLTLAVTVVSAIILLITWQIYPYNPEFHRKKELQDIANMQVIVDKIHSGEQLSTYSYSKYLIRFKYVEKAGPDFGVEGDAGYEEVYFYKVSYGKRHYGYYKGYLYSEDDVCDLFFSDVSVQYMRHIKDNWYYVEVY